jgi:hypothetical protein
MCNTVLGVLRVIKLSQIPKQADEKPCISIVFGLPLDQRASACARCGRWSQSGLERLEDRCLRLLLCDRFVTLGVKQIAPRDSKAFFLIGNA